MMDLTNAAGIVCDLCPATLATQPGVDVMHLGTPDAPPVHDECLFVRFGLIAR